MPLSAFALAFAAAWLHGASNVFMGARRDPEAATAIMLLVGVAAFAPVAAATWRVEAAAIPYMAASAVCELGYFTCLAAAYRRADVSVVYPIARGAAPVLVLLGQVVVARHATSAGEVAGVIGVATGIVLVRGIRGRADGRGVALALAAGTCTAGYMLLDKSGLRHAAPIPYIETVLIGPTLLYTALIWRVRGRAALRSEADPRTAAIAVILFGTYVIVLLALRLAPAASVSAVRETSVVVAVAVAALIAKERVGAGRVAGAALVAGGIVLLALT